MTVEPPACIRCVHYRDPSSPPSCDAFEGGIPALIWLRGDPHTGPVAGDHGIRFEPGTPHAGPSPSPKGPIP